MDNADNRREWLRRVALSAAGLSAGTTAACSKSQQKASAKKRAVLKRLTIPNGDLWVIFHGMLVFKLPKPVNSGSSVLGPNAVIEVHVPNINCHVYKAGPLPTSNYDRSDLGPGYEYTLTVNPKPSGSMLPTNLKTNPYNVFLSSAGQSCKASILPANTRRFCRITVPVPDDYSAPPAMLGGNSDDSVIFTGVQTTSCYDPFSDASNPHRIDQLKQINLIHIFIYHNVTSARLDGKDPSGTTVNQWTSSMPGPLMVYAEPADMTPPSDDHLLQLDDFLGLNQSDLDFTNGGASLSTVNTNTKEYESLASLATSSSDFSGSPADCISVWGS